MSAYLIILTMKHPQYSGIDIADEPATKLMWAIPKKRKYYHFITELENVWMNSTSPRATTWVFSDFSYQPLIGLHWTRGCGVLEVHCMFIPLLCHSAAAVWLHWMIPHFSVTKLFQWSPRTTTAFVSTCAHELSLFHTRFNERGLLEEINHNNKNYTTTIIIIINK